MKVYMPLNKETKGNQTIPKYGWEFTNLKAINSLSLSIYI